MSCTLLRTPPLRGAYHGAKRRRGAEALYELAVDFREAGWSSEPNYDEEYDLFRFADGEFAFLDE